MTERLLWSPLKLGPVTVRNRVVFSAHLTNYAVDGRPSPQHVAYYADRAEGGAGLIITEEHSTHPTDWPYEKLIHGFNRDVIPGYRAITEAVHAHRTPIFAQINLDGDGAAGAPLNMERLNFIKARIDEMNTFVNNVYLPDVLAIGTLYKHAGWLHGGGLSATNVMDYGEYA